MNFRITPLDVRRFRHLFGQDADALARAGVKRMVADAKPGYPCRVSLEDAEIGESVLLYVTLIWVHSHFNRFTALYQRN